MSTLLSRSLRPALQFRAPTRFCPPTPFRVRQFQTSAPKMDAAPEVIHEIQSVGEFKNLLNLKAADGSPLEIKDGDGKVVGTQEAILVDFFADWCGPCKAIAPLLKDMAKLEANKHVRFVKVDVDKLMDIAQEYRITAMPTFLFFNDLSKLNDSGFRAPLEGAVRGAIPPKIEASLKPVAAAAKAASDAKIAAAADTSETKAAAAPEAGGDASA